MGELHRLDRYAASDLLFEKIDDLLLEGKMEEADEAIRAIDVDKLDSSLLVGVLSVTLRARDLLRTRPALVRAIEKRLHDIVPGRVEELMSGLR